MSTGKPSEKEEEFFARQEFERRQRAARDRAEKEAAAERERRKALHFMHCPKCGMDLIEMELRSIKVDKCSGCEGIWLDAGELEALGKQEAGVLGRLLRGLR